MKIITESSSKSLIEPITKQPFVSFNEVITKKYFWGIRISMRRNTAKNYLHQAITSPAPGFNMNNNEQKETR